MSDELNRAELDARLETIEARMDTRVAVIEGRVALIEGKIDAFLTEFRLAVKYMQADIARLGNLKASIWSAAATVIAVVLSVMGLAGMFLEAGRNTSEVAREAARKEVESTMGAVAERAANAAVISFARDYNHDHGDRRGLGERNGEGIHKDKNLEQRSNPE